MGTKLAGVQVGPCAPWCRATRAQDPSSNSDSALHLVDCSHPSSLCSAIYAYRRDALPHARVCSDMRLGISVQSPVSSLVHCRHGRPHRRDRSRHVATRRDRLRHRILRCRLRKRRRATRAPAIPEPFAACSATAATIISTPVESRRRSATSTSCRASLSQHTRG